MAFELLLRSRGDDQISHLRRKETSQPTHALDFAYLVRDALFKLLVQFVQLIEQPRVLDGDDSLGGEILNQINLLVGEGAALLPVDANRTDYLIVLQHRNRK